MLARLPDARSWSARSRCSRSAGTAWTRRSCSATSSCRCTPPGSTSTSCPGTGPVVGRSRCAPRRTSQRLPDLDAEQVAPVADAIGLLLRRAGRHAADRVRRRAVHARLLPRRGRPEPQPRAHQGAHARRPGGLARAAGPARRHHRDVPAGAGRRRGGRRAAVRLVGGRAVASATTASSSCRTRRGCSPGWPTPACRGSTSASAPASCSARWREAGADVVGVDWRVPLDDGAPGATGGAPRRCRATSTRRCCSPTAATVEAEARRIVAEGRAAPRARLQPRPRRAARNRPGRAHPARRAGARPASRELASAVAVVGGGISGLAAAHRLRTLLGPAAEITVLEQRDRLGGVLRTVDLAGVPYDVGAEAFLCAAARGAASCSTSSGWPAQVVHPTGAAPSVRAGGARSRCPPARCWACRRARPGSTGVLSAGRRGGGGGPNATGRCDWTPGDDVALGALLRERFGDELADRLVDPLLGGVYAGRVDALGLRATVPALAAALDAGARSLTAAADRGHRPRRPRVRVWHGRCAAAAQPPVFGALRGGYARARRRPRRPARTSRLVDHGPRAGPARRRLAARSLGPRPGVPRRRRAWCSPCPRRRSRRLLAEVAPGRRRGRGGDRAGVVGRRRAGLPGRRTRRALPATSGVLVAAGEPRRRSRRRRTSSRKWAAPPAAATDGLVRLRASLGRFGEEATLQVDDAELVARVRADLADADRDHRRAGGGARAALGRRAAAVRRSGTSTGSPRSRTRVAEVPGLAVAGAALHGVGVPACVGTARAAAERLAGSWLAATAR